MTSLCLPSIPATPASEVRIKNELQLSCTFLCTVGFVGYSLIEFSRVLNILRASHYLKDWNIIPQPRTAGWPTDHRMTVIEHKIILTHKQRSTVTRYMAEGDLQELASHISRGRDLGSTLFKKAGNLLVWQLLLASRDTAITHDVWGCKSGCVTLYRPRKNAISEVVDLSSKSLQMLRYPPDDMPDVDDNYEYSIFRRDFGPIETKVNKATQDILNFNMSPVFAAARAQEFQERIKKMAHMDRMLLAMTIIACKRELGMAIVEDEEEPTVDEKAEEGSIATLVDSDDESLDEKKGVTRTATAAKRAGMFARMKTWRQKKRQAKASAVLKVQISEIEKKLLNMCDKSTRITNFYLVTMMLYAQVYQHQDKFLSLLRSADQECGLGNLRNCLTTFQYDVTKFIVPGKESNAIGCALGVATAEFEKAQKKHVKEMKELYGLIQQAKLTRAATIN